MAEKISYPQLPSTVWWGVRTVLNKTPNATLDERFLSIQLDVQEAAARQYVSELKRVGILNEEFRATSIAHRWRMEDSYREAVDELLASNYPEGLIQLAPADTADRARAAAWFQREGLGSGTAGNKAATYLLIGSATPNDAPSKASNGNVRTATVSKSEAKPSQNQVSARSIATRTGARKPNDQKVSKNTEPMPLNLNLQIHIGADASSDQIESIFSAMRKYLYSNETA